MKTKQPSERRGHAAVELQGRCQDLSPQEVVDSLSVGLTHLRDLLMVRAHDDVERKYGSDSMYGMSMSNTERQLRHAKVEIEAYSCIVIDDEVTLNGYVDNAGDWFLDWIFRLRLGGVYESVFDKRVNYYRSQSIEERRLKFVSVLAAVHPAERQGSSNPVPSVSAIGAHLAAVAFGDPLRAQELRAEQNSFLPAISECHECHGRVLDNEEICPCCGNPVWSFTWLLSD